MKNLFFFSLFMFPFFVLSQEFYIDKGGDVNYTNHKIQSSWVDLNENEARNFLIQSGFTRIQTETNGDTIEISGYINKREYEYVRTLIFSKKNIKGYIDGIAFPFLSTICMAKSMKKNYSSYTMELYYKGLKSGVTIEEALRNKFLKYHRISLINNGYTNLQPHTLSELEKGITHIYSTPNVNKNINNFSSFCSVVKNTNCLYYFSSYKSYHITSKDYFVKNYDLKKIDQFDLDLMVNVFLEDCKLNGINLKKGKISVSFEVLKNSTLGLSYGINNDSMIKLKIDPILWSKASAPKRWYLLYHELGHDVLNFEHGQGGKMMFNFADTGYSWKEFWDDRARMFASYKRNKTD